MLAPVIIFLLDWTSVDVYDLHYQLKFLLSGKSLFIHYIVWFIKSIVLWAQILLTVLQDKSFKGHQLT